MRVVILTSVLFFIGPSFAQARWRTPCGVSYQRANATWSRFYDQQCSFMFGQELNQATGSYSYSYGQVYVAVWWGDGQVVIINPDLMVAIDSDFDGRFTAVDARSVFLATSAFRGRQVNGRRRWRVSVRRGPLGWATF